MIGGFDGFARSIGLRRGQLLQIIGVVVLLSQAIALLILAGPLLMMHLFDGVMETRNSDTMVVLCIMFVVLQVLSAVMFVQRQALVRAAVAVLERRLILATVRAAMRLARDGQPEQANATISDFSLLRRFLASAVVIDFLGLLAIPLPLYFLFMLHPLLGWVAVLGCVCMCGFGLVTERRGRSLVQAAAVVSNRTVVLLSGHLRRRDEVTGLGLLPGIVRLWAPQRWEALQLHQAATTRAQVLSGMSSGLGSVFVVLATAVSTWAVIAHEAAPAAFIVSFQILPRVLGPCEGLSQSWLRWSEALFCARRLQASLALARSESLAPAESSDPDLQIVGLRLQVPDSDTVLVDDLHLRAPPGTMVAITGRNAAGKSTLLRALMGLHAPVSGGILFRGWLMHMAERSAVGPHIGFLAQRAQLLRGSVLDNICRFSNDGPGAIEAARRCGAHEMIGRLPAGYATEVSVNGGSGLSGGQQRQVALARALYRDPGLLVLDEPEVGLDEPALLALVAAIAEARERGAIIFLVTHDLARWEGIADLELRLEGRGSWTTKNLQPQPLLQATA